MIFDERKHAKDMIAEGGEGRVYSTGSGTLVKIFKKTVNMVEKEGKLNILAAKHLPGTVVVPVAIVTTPSGTFSGYEMQMVHGDEMRDLSSIKFIRANNITKRDIVFMLVQIKNTLKMLHAQGIIIGDLNDSNVLFDQNYGVHFIDVDSWTIPPYRCSVVMDTFKDPHLAGDDFTAGTDAYAFAIIAYKALTRLHPFGGTMASGVDLDIVTRMQRKISAINNPGVITPVIIDKDSFMPRSLVSAFKSIFEGNGRFLIDAELDEFQGKMSLCTVHKDYYYSSYTSCPVCVPSAVEISTPVVMPSVGGVPSRVLFQIDGAVVIDENCYVASGMACFRNSTISIPYTRGVQYHATGRGDAAFQVHRDKIVISRISGKEIAIPTKYNSPSVARDDGIYFVSPGLQLTGLRVLGNDIAEEAVEQVSFNSFFGIIDPKTYLIYNMYDDGKIISVSGRHISVPGAGKVEDVSVHFDAVKGQWLLVVTNGRKVETIVIDKDRGITMQTSGLQYPCSPSRCDYSNGFIYMPSDGKITRVDPATGTTRVFTIPGMTTDTRIRKAGAKFIASDISAIREIG